MTTYTATNGAIIADLTALRAIPSTDLPASGFVVLFVAAENSWYEYDSTLTSGDVIPTDSPATGRWLRIGRDRLRANRTYYVRTDGSDSNNGLANTSGGAFLTWQKAFDVVGSLDLSIFDVTIAQGNNGTLAGGLVKSAVGSGKIIIQGDVSTPANCVMSSALDVTNCTSDVEVRGIRFTGTFNGEAGSAITAVNNKSITITGNCTFANTAGRHIYCLQGLVNINSSYSITGGGVCHYIAFIGGKIVNAVSGVTITLTGTPAFAAAFVFADRCAVINIPTALVTFSGSATGTRYSVAGNAVINSGGGGATYFPGNVSGTTATGGQYL